MLNVTMPQILLDGVRIRILVGQGKSAGVPRHMRMDWKRQGSRDTRTADNVVNCALPTAVDRDYMAWRLAELGDFVEGVSMGEDAVRLAEAVAQPANIAAALWPVGLVSRRQEDVHTAIPVLEQALALSPPAFHNRLS
jgi:hypothetical protein